MRNTFWRALLAIGRGIAMGCTIFVLLCMGFSAAGAEEQLQQIMATFVWQGLGSMAVGVAFSLPAAFLYQDRRALMLPRILVHAAIGIATYLAVGLALGWIVTTSLWSLILGPVIALCVFAILWTIFYLQERHAARRINARIRELDDVQSAPAEREAAKRP